MKHVINGARLPLKVKYIKTGRKCQARLPLSFIWGEAEAVAAACLTKGGALFTPNALMLQYAATHPDFARLLSSATLVPDGVGALWALRAAGQQLTSPPARLPGVELGMALAKEGAARGLSLYLYGGRAGVARQAAARLQDAIPSLSIAGTAHGYGEQKTALQAITASGAGLVFVCLGSPTQEYAVCRLLAQAPHMTAVGLGGSLDIYAGRLSRAPRLFCATGTEWLYRMLRQPRRLQKLPAMMLFAANTLMDLAKKPKKCKSYPLEKKNMTKMTNL